MNINSIIEIAHQAGEAILKIYQQKELEQQEEQQQWMKNLPSLIHQRREVFKHGDLERITGEGKKQNVELVLGSKSGQKTPVNDSETAAYINDSGLCLRGFEVPNTC